MDSSRQHPLQSKNISSVIYHDIFDYPLTTAELQKWYCTVQIKTKRKIAKQSNYSFLAGREKIIEKRLANERTSKKKLAIATRAASILSRVPNVLFIGITGSLAMQNSKKESDIDFLIITKEGTMWTTRLFCYLICMFEGLAVRKPKDKNEKDLLCLNMWLDESDLYFDKQNLFTAHELAQIIPLVNKNKTYEKLINTNKWMFNYWPNAIQKPDVREVEARNKKQNLILLFAEQMAYLFQLKYMESKKSREVATPTRAFFHPFDWGEKVILELEKRNRKTKK